MDLLERLANEFHIPIIDDEDKVWFFRTKKGTYYHDFVLNGYVALGWDLVSPNLVLDRRTSWEVKKDIITRSYPDEKRPGLILGQLDAFYNQMREDDLIVIPSTKGKHISIGKIGELIEEIDHMEEADEYEKCSFIHRRKVTWMKNVPSWQDIYLFKALRAHQTISDITDEAELVFRNLFSTYICDGMLHVSFQKETVEEFNASDNVELQCSLLDIADEVAKMYGAKSFRREINCKTAVGSPGFLEMIFPDSPIALIYIAVVTRIFTGKAKGPDGTTMTGLLAVISKVNDLLNDYHNRKKTDAETESIIANTRLTNAQVEKTLSEASKNQAEAELMLAKTRKLNNEVCHEALRGEQIKYVDFAGQGKTTEQVRLENEALTIPTEESIEAKTTNIISKAEIMCKAASNNGISFDGKKIKELAE